MDEKITTSTWEKQFLQKIAPTFAGTKFPIPEPTLNPIERCRLRTLHRNEQFLYRNTSSFSQKPIISIYAEDQTTNVVSREEWFSETWDATEYTIEFNFSDSFFYQFQKLQKKVPRAATVVANNENCEYTTGVAYSKNCYLINSSEYCEDCMYSKLLQNCSNVVDSSYCEKSELLYQCFNVQNGYDCKWLYNSQNCSECWFGDDLKNCQNCFLCTNLNSKQYYFKNQKYNKEAYLKKIEPYIGDHQKIQEAINQFETIRSNRYVKHINATNTENSSGDLLYNTKDCQWCFDMSDCQDCMYVQVGIGAKDVLDCSNMYLSPELCYQVLGTLGAYNSHFCIYVFHSNNMLYSEQCYNCDSCFGCVGLRNKKYHIFNIPYDKETYEIKVAELITHMQRTGEWGQFFPAWLSPFPYNKTIAQEYYPLNESEAKQRGYKWENENDQRDKMLPQDYTVPDKIENVKNTICNTILSCERTSKNYRILPQEFKFYKDLKLPIPKTCPQYRYQERLKIRNQRLLNTTTCSDTGIQILTTYPTNSSLDILTETAYLKRMNG